MLKIQTSAKKTYKSYRIFHSESTMYEKVEVANVTNMKTQAEDKSSCIIPHMLGATDL